MIRASSVGYVTLDEDISVSMEPENTECAASIDREIEDDEETTMVHETNENLSLLRRKKPGNSHRITNNEKVCVQICKVRASLIWS